MNETVALCMELGAISVRARIAETQVQALVAKVGELEKVIAERDATIADLKPGPKLVDKKN